MKVNKGKLEVLLSGYQLSWDTYRDDFNPRHNDREFYLIRITNNKTVYVVYNQNLYDRMSYSNDVPVVDIVLDDGTVLSIVSSTKDYWYKTFDTYKQAIECILNTDNIVCDII